MSILGIFREDKTINEYSNIIFIYVHAKVQIHLEK